ncbi:MAG: hypothetical protein V4684_17075 [Pseudomonadota bacterium]
MASTKKVPSDKVNAATRKVAAKKAAAKQVEPKAKPAPRVAKAVPARAPAPAPRPGPAPAPAPTALASLTRIPAAVPPAKSKKAKLVRDSFTIPKPEYAVLDELKQRVARAGLPVKKSELLRAGIKALAAMSDTALLAAVAAVPAIKTGRPAKD